MNSLHKTRRGTILAAALIGLVVGGLIVGSLLKLVSQDTMATEKEIGHAKAAQILKLASILQNTVVGNSTLSQSQQDALSLRIGGGSPTKPIFGSSSSSTPSTIPGFDQFSVEWDQTITPPSVPWTLQQPTDPNGFWFFPGSMTSSITATHSGDSVPTLRNGTKAILSSTNPTQTVPAFSMLSFYNNDWEISAHYESAQLIGRVNSNGSIYLDCRDSGPDRVRFHALQNFPSLSSPNAVYRRGRNGATSYYRFGSTANAGLDFNVYTQSNFNSLIASDLNYMENTARVTFPTGGGNTRDMTPDFTNLETAPINTDTGTEPVARRFAGNGANFGYVFTGTSSTTGATFDATAVAPATTPTVAAVQFGTQVPTLQPPVTINPFQYIEDHQYADTPDVILEAFPGTTPSNYADDLALTSSLTTLSFSAIAPLVIRDGVAYYRSTPGGDLAPVMDLLGPAAEYPDSTFTVNGVLSGKKYGDLRWYGHFGQNSGVNASPSNPDRWHFPIRSVTFNRTVDNNNGGNVNNILPLNGINPPTTEGSAVPFTFNSNAVMNPLNDGVSSGTASWINVQQDLSDISSAVGLGNYPDLANTATTSVAPNITGAGVGMWNVSYPTIGSGGVEMYDPVRVAYNIVKENVRRLHNAHHIYTSRHNGAKMLNTDSSVPADNEAPNLWGPVTPMPNLIAFDIDADGNITDPGENMVDYTGDSVRDYSAFWNDDGALYDSAGAAGTAPVMRWYRYQRDQTAGTTDARRGQLILDGSSPLDSTPRVELFPIRDISLINGGSLDRINNWFIYKSTLPLSDRTLPMPGNRDFLDGWDHSNVNAIDYIDNSNTVVVAVPPKPIPFPIAAVSAGGNNTGRNSPRCRNFGFAGATSNTGVFTVSPNAYRTSATNFSYHNWYTLLNNAPEMLARQGSDFNMNTYSSTSTSINRGITFEADFGYFAQREAGGYYGIDNLCTIDAQEKKILVFTELDMSELTSECFQFNGLTAAWGFNFFTNTADATTPTQLQNILYVVNTSMGKNFFGKRVHCGAVRLKRGALIDYPLSIATPNALHVWGDFNSPGYWHHGKGGGTANVNYTVPSAHEFPSTAVTRKPVGLYADTIAAYENSFIPFNQSDGSSNSILDNSYGALQNPSGDFEECIYADQKLWWEDDGMRTKGVASVPMNHGSTAPVITAAGAQTFMNYHQTIFNHANNNYYAANSAWERSEAGQIWKHMPQSVSAGFMYGNVPSYLPSYFFQANVDAIQPVNSVGTAVTRPAAIDQLDWFMSWIRRTPQPNGTPGWVELTRNQMRSDLAGTVTNGGFNISTVDSPSGTYFIPAASLTPANYFGTTFSNTVSGGATNTSAATAQFYNLQLKFSGGGFLYDIRTFDNHTHNLPEPGNGSKQSYGRNLLGSFTCLYPARQNTHGFNQTMLGIENQQVFCSYDQNFNTASSLPPGTPMTTIVPQVNYQLEGTRWQYQ